MPESSRVGIAKIVFGSLATGLAAAVLLPFLPVSAVNENFSTGMVLIGFALGWALLAGLSTRFTDQPQRWAVAPAVFMGLAGVIVLLVHDALVDALGWVWPPALLILVVWVFIRARRDLHSRSRGWLLNPVLGILVLACLAGGYETISRSVAAVPAMHGRLVDVGPYRLHLECAGSGRPTVILEPGGGASAATLGWIAPAVARHTRVCVYDRAGRGWSDAAPSPPDGAQIATDLHTLLERAHQQVAGLVLVDSTAPTSTPVPPQHPGSYSFVKHLSSLVSTASRLGVGRLIASVQLLGATTTVARPGARQRRHRQGDGELRR